MALAVTRKEGD